MKSRKRKYIHLKLLELSSPALKRLKTHENCVSTCTSETRIKRYKKKENFIIKNVDVQFLHLSGKKTFIL